MVKSGSKRATLCIIILMMHSCDGQFSSFLSYFRSDSDTAPTGQEGTANNRADSKDGKQFGGFTSQFGSGSTGYNSQVYNSGYSSQTYQSSYLSGKGTFSSYPNSYPSQGNSQFSSFSTSPDISSSAYNSKIVNSLQPASINLSGSRYQSSGSNYQSLGSINTGSNYQSAGSFSAATEYKSSGDNNYQGSFNQGSSSSQFYPDSNSFSYPSSSSSTKVPGSSSSFPGSSFKSPSSSFTSTSSSGPTKLFSLEELKKLPRRTTTRRPSTTTEKGELLITTSTAKVPRPLVQDLSGDLPIVATSILEEVPQHNSFESTSQSSVISEYERNTIPSVLSRELPKDSNKRQSLFREVPLEDVLRSSSPPSLFDLVTTKPKITTTTKQPEEQTANDADLKQEVRELVDDEKESATVDEKLESKSSIDDEQESTTNADTEQVKITNVDDGTQSSTISDAEDNSRTVTDLGLESKIIADDQETTTIVDKEIDDNKESKIIAENQDTTNVDDDSVTEEKQIAKVGQESRTTKTEVNIVIDETTTPDYPVTTSSSSTAMVTSTFKTVGEDNSDEKAENRNIVVVPIPSSTPDPAEYLGLFEVEDNPEHSLAKKEVGRFANKRPAPAKAYRYRQEPTHDNIKVPAEFVLSRTVEVDDYFVEEKLTGYNNEEVDIINDKLVAPTAPTSPTNSVIQLIKGDSEANQDGEIILPYNYVIVKDNEYTKAESKKDNIKTNDEERKEVQSSDRTTFNRKITQSPLNVEKIARPANIIKQKFPFATDHVFNSENGRIIPAFDLEEHSAAGYSFNGFNYNDRYKGNLHWIEKSSEPKFTITRNLAPSSPVIDLKLSTSPQTVHTSAQGREFVPAASVPDFLKFVVTMKPASIQSRSDNFGDSWHGYSSVGYW